MLNCKEGDLALIVRAQAPYDHMNGLVITCIKFLGCPDRIQYDGETYQCQDHDIWEVDKSFKFLSKEGRPVVVNWVKDEWLMPITPPPEMKEQEAVAPVQPAVV